MRIKKNDTDGMLALLKEQEARLVEKQLKKAPEGPIMLSPKIDVEECIRLGCITAEEYRNEMTIICRKS